MFNYFKFSKQNCSIDFQEKPYYVSFFTVEEIIAKPSCRVEELPEYKYENWMGDLDKYYQ
ncbi:hypothetical protein DRO19_01670 [Candidatus Bathyarchaeota archaeon]|nr:MAG: hypothetical protein DRO19_01670 [Candidatus Bathyarchaeota archaeon]